MGWALALVLPLLGCGDGTGASGLVLTERDSAGVTVAEVRIEPTAVPEARLGAPELIISGGDPPYFGRLGAVRWLADGAIAAADRQADQVFVFGTDGELRRTLGRSGDGPGEFSNIRGLYRKGDTLLVHDLGHDRLTVFDAAGEVVRTIPLSKTLTEEAYERLYLMAPVSGGGMVGHRLYSDYLQEEEVASYARMLRSEAVIARYDDSGTALEGPEIRFPGATSVAMTPTGGRFMDIGLPFSGRPLVDVAPDRVVYASGDRYRYTVAGPDLHPRRVVRWPAAAEPLTEAEVERLRGVQDSIWSPYMSRETIRDIHAVLFHPDRTPETRPALDDLLVDREGRVWAARWDWADDATPLHIVHDSTGRPLFRLRLPARSRLEDVSGNRVLLVTRDSLDVESLVVRRVVAPSTETPEG